MWIIAFTLKEGANLKVSMLTETSWDGKFCMVGEELEVPDDVGERWEKYKIAVSLETEETDKEPTLAELKVIAKGLGIEGYTKMNKTDLTAVIEAKEAELKQAEVDSLKTLELDQLKAKAVELGVKNVGTLTQEQLIEAIAKIEFEG